MMLRVMVMFLLLVGLAACGDSTTGPLPSIPDVTGFTIDKEASNGTTVVLNWEPVSDESDAVDGYILSIRTRLSGSEWGSWSVVDTLSASSGITTYSHAASFAGQYGIKAYLGEDISANYTTVDDLPTMIRDTYTIWNNHCPSTAHSGFIFGLTSGATCLTSSGDHDVYCYDGGEGNLTWLYSGDYGAFGEGNPTDLYFASGYFATPGWGPVSPPARPLIAGGVLFAELQNGYWVKIYVISFQFYTGGSPNAWGSTFCYDIQPIRGLKLFTTDYSV
jgi:hypothetical protein